MRMQSHAQISVQISWQKAGLVGQLLEPYHATKQRNHMENHHTVKQREAYLEKSKA